MQWIYANTNTTAATAMANCNLMICELHYDRFLHSVCDCVFSSHREWNIMGLNCYVLFWACMWSWYWRDYQCMQASGTMYDQHSDFLLIGWYIIPLACLSNNLWSCHKIAIDISMCIMVRYSCNLSNVSCILVCVLCNRDAFI